MSSLTSEDALVQLNIRLRTGPPNFFTYCAFFKQFSSHNDPHGGPVLFFLLWFNAQWQLPRRVMKKFNLVEECFIILDMDILPTNEYTEFEDRYYLNPQTGIERSENFIDNLRATQAQNTQQIVQDTQMLGTDVSSNLGGLTGANSYFVSRYQAPQTVSAAANLRAAAQAAALNQVLENEQEKWKKRYQDAYRNYQRRASAGSGLGSTDGQPSTSAGEGSVTTTVSEDELEARGALNISDDDISRGGRYIVSQDFNRYGGHDIIWITPEGEQVTIPQLSGGTYPSTNIPTLLKNLGLTRFTGKG